MSKFVISLLLPGAAGNNKTNIIELPGAAGNNKTNIIEH